jgi:TonB-dependent SusC/RagA subfamily outer membrane receptor
VVTYIGFITQEIPLKGQSNFIIKLLENASTLTEVVVVGYGTQKKTKISGSIATVSISELQDFPVSNFDQALAGKLAGVQVLQTSGEPGRELSIKVRGTKTLTAGAEPLYVIDGVPMETAGRATEAVNMEDIESIQVLKDAASTAIYGSRGSNGIVIITTNRYDGCVSIC